MTARRRKLKWEPLQIERATVETPRSRLSLLIHQRAVEQYQALVIVGGGTEGTAYVLGERSTRGGAQRLCRDFARQWLAKHAQPQHEPPPRLLGDGTLN